MANNNETTIENPFNTGNASKKKDNPQQPKYADLVAVDNVQPNYADLVEVNKGVGGHFKDIGTSLAAGAASLPDIAIGLGDLYSGGRAGKAIEDSGIYTPGSGSDYWRDQKTINAKAQDQQRQAADGIIDKTKVVLSNPSQITNAIGESLAPMATGGLVGRGINIASKGKIGAAAAGALGEGTVMAGSQAENIRQETDDGLLTNGQVGAAVATGVAGSAFGYLGGRIAKELGFSDIDNMLANGVRAEAVQETAKKIPMSTIPKSILYGAVSEGILEELPQSVSEQALQNIALGKPWNENLDDAAVMGTLAGMAMGGGINAYTSTQDYLNAQRSDNGGASPTDSNAPNLPALLGGNGGDALTGEYIPRADQSSQPEQSRTNYEYDQFSTDADNLLGQGNGFNPMQGNYPENPDSPIAPTTSPLSRQLGINPEDGPMSTAAALAVDSGVSSAQDPTSNKDTPLSDSAAMLDQDESNFPDFKAQHESNIKTLYDQGMGENVTLKNGEQVRLIQTNDEANGEGAYNLNAINNDGEIVGSLGYFTIEEEGNSFNPQLHVDEQHRRNGIATAMYDYAEANGAKIPELDATAGALRTEQGQAFREARHARRNGQEPKQKDVPEFNIDQKIENADHSIEWHKENIELATNEYDKKRSQDAIEELQKEREDLSQKKAANLILGTDGQNKWFGNQDKANAFIEKKKLGDSHQVVKTDNKRFEIQPKESQLSAVTPKADAVTLTIDNQIQTMQHQYDSEKSIPKKVHLQKQLEDLKAQRADITTQEQSQVAVQKQETASSFQTQPLDHGTLNVPLAKRGNIDNQLDRYKKEQAAVENKKREIRNSEHVDAKSVAKPMFDTLSSDHIKVYADKAGIKPSEAKKELKSMAHWQPEKAVKVFEALKAVKSEQGDSLTPPNLPNLSGVEEIQALEQQLAVEKNVPKKARLRKQIAELQKNNPIDRAAHEAATSTQNDLSEPTQAQIEAGNYKKGHIKVHGLDIAVENPRGSERRGTDPDGKEWAHTMSDHYGYIKRTTGADQEQIDTYVGKNPESEKVYIVDQINQGNGGFDEHKVMMGFDTQEEAVAAYQSNFDKGWKVGPVKEMSKDQFKDWLKNSDTSKPAASKNLKDSIENIRAEKIRKKTVDDLHRLFASAPDIDLEKAITRLDKAIQKNHEKSIGEMSGGKRSTRKAVASGAVDTFRKQKMDLEVYLKARKSGEVKQRETSVLGKNSKGLDDARSNDVQNQEKPLYSRQSGNQKTSSSIQQVRDVLVERFGEDVISELERQGKLEIIQDYQVEGVEGFYYNGKAVLVASNLTKETAVPTFLHELGGHGGFQNMMNEKQYQELMRQFDKLVEQGNPVALAAKLLAEREQGSERQQLEYLPYLLTLSSTMQQRNVIQRNALQKLIHNIVAYVKAWAFDQFGINLNLNPDDMLALSERMIGQIKHQSSLDLIRQKYHGTSQWMTAPNGAKTHLSEQQWLQVRTPEFKKWFGDWENDAANASQVLDENGEPKVVYHGTATEFNEFKQGHGLLGDGIYLTDSFDIADVYANVRGKNGFVIPLFVNIRNAFKTTGNVSRDKFVEATSSGKYQGVVHQFENKEYIVALEPNQVKMAEGNATFNSESVDIRFSRADQGVADRLSENIKNLYDGKFKLPSMADAMKYGLMFLSRMQITDIYKKILPQLSVYNDLVHQMDADKNDIAAEADNIVREWSKLKDEEALASVMHEATLAQIDPAKPHQQGDNKVKYQQLLKNYNNLSPEAQAMYKKARNAYNGHYAKVREAIRERILRSALSSQKKADLLKNIEGSFGQIKGVYFPLARFGKYVVVVRNQNGDVESISRAETENEANALREQLIQKYPQFKIDSVIRDQDYNALRDKVGRGFMSDLFDEVGNLGLDAKKQAEFEDTLSQLYLSSMPDLSWAKHGMHRKGTAGFSQNARRAFAQNMSSGAGYLAKLRYGDQLVAQLDEMKEYSKSQIKKDPSYKQPLASAVIDEMNARHENLMNAKGNAISSLLTSMGFIYFLGLSPAAAMVNILQTPLVAYPILGAKFGFDKAGLELLKASADYAKGVGFEMPDFTNLDSLRNSLSDSIDPDIAKVLKEHEKQAYEKAVSAGVIDVTQAHDLAGIAQGEDSGVMWKIRPIMRVASLMFHHAERFNREVTFIAAYRLSKESGMADSDAYKQAVKMTYDGHFDYSASNRARFMQGNVAKVVFLFKQFGQNMIYTVARQSYIALIGKNHTKEERVEAARALSAMLVTHALAAGVLGLPMVTTLLAVASMFGGGDDDPWDAEVALRNGLADMTSPKFSNLVMKGLSRGTPADISGRVGLDSMFLARAPDGLEGQKLYEQLILGNMGATVGMGANIAKGIQELGQGNYARALEEMLPTFAKNPFKSYRYATEGVQDKTGVDILDGNPVSGAGIFSQTIGFSPSQVRTAYEGKSAVYQQEQALKKRKSKLTAKWVRAKRNDDQEGMDSAWKDIQEFNEVNPKLRIKRINLMQSYHQNAKRIRDAENGVYLSKKYRNIGDYGRFAETD